MNLGIIQSAIARTDSAAPGASSLGEEDLPPPLAADAARRTADIEAKRAAAKRAADTAAVTKYADTMNAAITRKYDALYRRCDAIEARLDQLAERDQAKRRAYDALMKAEADANIKIAAMEKSNSGPWYH
jgi:hypothetical protein